MSSVLHIVHCIDTEGPLRENLSDTFSRMNSAFGLDISATPENLISLQHKRYPLNGKEDAVAKMIAPELLAYNNDWDMIGSMLDDAMSPAFRGQMKDDTGRGWVYSWHCMDHAGYSSNPRLKDTAYGAVIRFYKEKIKQTQSVHDEINWHFHPLSFSRNPLQCATSYVNSYDVLMQVLARRIIDDGFYPMVNRPGFHSERPDSHAFLEQWIPYDYANQFDEAENTQPDLMSGRFGDWRRASASWRGYRPHHDDYQAAGMCRRWIFRCLNVGTRHRVLTVAHVREAFAEAQETGCAILAFSNHDYRDIRPDVQSVRAMITQVKTQFPDVQTRFSGAREAAVAHTRRLDLEPYAPLQFQVVMEGRVLHVCIAEGSLFGPQPFLALKTKAGMYHHDNFDIQTPGKHYTYIFDAQTVLLEALEVVGVGAAGRCGTAQVKTVIL
jgi:hypothetical protein